MIKCSKTCQDLLLQVKLALSLLHMDPALPPLLQPHVFQSYQAFPR